MLREGPLSDSLMIFEHFAMASKGEAEKYKSRLAWGFKPEIRECLNTDGVYVFCTTEEVEGKRAYSIRFGIVKGHGIVSFHLPKDAKPGHYDTRRRAERGWRLFTSPTMPLAYDGEFISMNIEGAVSPLPASQKPKANETEIERIERETGRKLSPMEKFRIKNPGVEIHPAGTNQREAGRFPYNHIKARPIVAEAVLKVKDGTFTYIGEVMEFCERKGMDGYTEDNFKLAFRMQTKGEEVSKYFSEE